jgi:hypothetical protein
MQRIFVAFFVSTIALGACVGQCPQQLAASPTSNAAAIPSAESSPSTTNAEVRPGKPGGGVDENFFVFLLIGQSNMEGAPKPEPDDLVENSRVLALAYDDCPKLGRVHDRWYTARAPLHGCYAGVGPGDAFGRAAAAAFPKATIGLVPAAISGVDIDFFRKGVVSKRRKEFRIPPDDHFEGAYEWLLGRARVAQQSGRIRGVLFHQGESDTGNAEWLDKVSGMVADLRADLGLGPVPFVAGELLHGGCCSVHNALVNRIPRGIQSSFVVSAQGLNGMDQAHFDLAGQRELGKRYADQMLAALAD